MATRKRQPRPKPLLAHDVVEEARVALLSASRMSEASAHAALVLFALSRALRREDESGLAALATAARQALDEMGETSHANGRSLAVDDVTHRRLVVHTMREILLHHREALARTDRRLPPPLPASHVAEELSRMLGAGPLRDLYASKRTREHDGDAERILVSWSAHVAGDGRIRVDEDPSALARKLVVSALVALGVPRKTALEGLARKVTPKKGTAGKGKRPTSPRTRALDRGPSHRMRH
jgi:hypothetical protein